LINKLAKSSKFLSPPQADGVLRNFAPSGTDFAKTWNPHCKLRGIPFRIKTIKEGKELKQMRNTKVVKVDLRFSTADARIKLKRLYPKIND